MNILVTHLRAIMTGLRAAIAAHAARPYADAGLAPRPITPELRAAPAQPPAAMFVLVWSYIGRTAARLERLITLWQAGTLPTPQTPRPRAPGPAAQPAKPRLPGGRAWLAAAAGYQTRGHASQLNHLLARPDFENFAAAVPQAARHLRPLCQMLGMSSSDPELAPIRLPPRPRKPRPKAEPKRRLTPLRFTRAQIDRMTAAELTHLYGRLPPHFPLPIPNLNHIRRKIAAG